MNINDITPEMIGGDKGKKTVYVIGHIDAGKTCLATLQAIEAASKKHDINFVMVESLNELKGIVGAELIGTNAETGKPVILIDGRGGDIEMVNMPEIKPPQLMEDKSYLITKMPDFDRSECYTTEDDLRKQNKKKRWQSSYKFHR